MLPERVRSFILRRREIILYAIFGVLTTVVNFIVYFAWTSVFPGKYSNVSATAAAWIIAVAFAYFTNREWVFQSKAAGLVAGLKECAAFFAGRIFSGAVDLAIMYIAVDLMLLDGKVIKLLSNILVIILNYILSKFFVFNKK